MDTSPLARALLESQKRYERMANTVPVMLYDSVLEPDGTSRFLYVAPKPCREILELDPEAVLRDMSLVWAIVHPEDLERFHQEDLAANRAGKEFTSEIRIITPAGRLKWLLVNSKPNPAAPGELVVWSGYLQDITERKQVGTERSRLARLVDAAPAAITIHDPEGNFLYANQKALDMHGYSREEFMALNLHEIDDPESAKLIEYRNRQIEAEGGASFEASHFRKDGSLLPLHVSIRLAEWENQAAVESIAVDITERKRAERALQESEYFFRESQRSASIGSYKADLVTGHWQSSEVLDAIFGIGPDYRRDMQGWFDIVHPEDREMLERYLEEEVIGQKKSLAKEYRIIRINDREERWVRGFGAVMPDSGGHGVLLMGTIQDVTTEKRAEEERARLEAQLHQAQRIESVGRLAGGVAHDFNNMLSVILGHAELALAREAASPSLREHLAQIQKAAERSAEIVRQLLAFARKQTVTPKVLDLNETGQDMLKMLRRLIGEGIDLCWASDKALWSIKMDPAQIDQILANLCINARDAITETGRIAIGAKNKSCDATFCAGHTGLSPGDYVLLTVSDNGSGMDQEVLKKIFEPFFTTKDVGEGTGLGLATVYGIVKQNGGFIEVHSAPGRGTTFHIYLPRYLDRDAAARTAQRTGRVEGGRETVLLVEDEPAILDVGTQLLEMQGYRVLAAGTPGEAIRLAEEHAGEIHLLMTDVVMPEMNGRELANKLLSLHPGMKSLFMSGYTADVIAHHGVLEEGVNFIQKPFTLPALAGKVREVLG